MTSQPSAPLALDDLVKLALEQGVRQVEAAGSPLHPLLFDETGRLILLFDEQGAADPMALACAAIREHAAEAVRCALVIDTRITFSDGKKWDAITVMACERGAGSGVVWAQRYVPRKLFRKFRTEGSPEEVGKSKDFISFALAQDQA